MAMDLVLLSATLHRTWATRPWTSQTSSEWRSYKVSHVLFNDGQIVSRITAQLIDTNYDTGTIYFL